VNIEQFATLLINSRLSSRHEVEELVAVFHDECCRQNVTDTLDTFCEFLISTARLTAWQCDKLRKGKWKGFYLDNYLLLEQIGKDYDFCYYKARDARNGKLVRLTITPMIRAKGPDIEYKVDPYSD
jgi:hypothetical protein